MRPAAPGDERTLPILSGVLLFLACPPAAFLLPSFLGLVPLLVFIAERPAGAAGRWSATSAGLLTGLVYFGLQLYWIAVALVRYSALAIPAYLLTVLVLAGLTAAFGWVVHYLRDHLDLPLAVLAALCWTALEWTQAHLGALSFPWLGLGTTLAPFPRIAGAADLVGARGLTLWLAAVNGMVAAMVVRVRAGGGGAERALPALVAGTALLLAVPVAYGFWRAGTLELRPVSRVAIVQPNIPEDLKLDPRVAVDTSLSALRALTGELDGGQAGEIDLVAWPEVALPVELADGSGLLGTIEDLSRRAGAPILAGAYGVGASADGPRFNSAFLVGAAGAEQGRYDKRRLVPFVERVPFLDPTILQRPLTAALGPRAATYFGSLAPGRNAPLLETRTGARFGVLICYESIFAPLAREYRLAGADFLVNITNDAWYGREPWYERTTALWQHPAHLVMRAIETRTGVARAANTGISMYVDPLGRTHERTPLFEPAVRTEMVLTTDVVTVFVRWGDWVGWLAVVALAALATGSAGASQRARLTPRNGLG